MSCSEERDDLNQSLGQWKNKADSLEKTNRDIRNLISILEDDIRTGRKEYEALKTSVEQLASEKEQVCSSTFIQTEAIASASFVYYLLCFSSVASGAN